MSRKGTSSQQALYLQGLGIVLGSYSKCIGASADMNPLPENQLKKNKENGTPTGLVSRRGHCLFTCKVLSIGFIV